MSLNSVDIEKIAHLARLEIPEQEIARYTHELSSILKLVAHLGSASTAGITPMAHPLHMQQRLRADIITEQDQHIKYQAIAPLVKDGLYLVPKVID